MKNATLLTLLALALGFSACNSTETVAPDNQPKTPEGALYAPSVGQAVTLSKDTFYTTSPKGYTIVFDLPIEADTTGTMTAIDSTGKSETYNVYHFVPDSIALSLNGNTGVGFAMAYSIKSYSDTAFEMTSYADAAGRTAGFTSFTATTTQPEVADTVVSGDTATSPRSAYEPRYSLVDSLKNYTFYKVGLDNPNDTLTLINDSTIQWEDEQIKIDTFHTDTIVITASGIWEGKWKVSLANDTLKFKRGDAQLVYTINNPMSEHEDFYTSLDNTEWVNDDISDFYITISNKPNNGIKIVVLNNNTDAFVAIYQSLQTFRVPVIDTLEIRYTLATVVNPDESTPSEYRFDGRRHIKRINDTTITIRQNQTSVTLVKK